MMRRLMLLSACLLIAAAPASAQTSSRVRGTIASLDGVALHVKSTAGQDVAITLSPAYAVTAIVPAKLSEIQPGSFIGIAADAQPDGTLVAREVHIFPEAMRGTGEGFRPFDLGPKSTMTNGTVGQNVKSVAGNTVTVAYKGGEKNIVIPPDAPVVTFAPGDRTMLVPGAHVIIQAHSDADGGLTTDRVAVGKDGLVPPM